MKIIRVDNFNREGPGHDDRLVALNVIPFEGAIMTDALNNKFSQGMSSIFYRLVEDDYQLYEWKP